MGFNSAFKGLKEGKLAKRNTGFILCFQAKKRKENLTLCLHVCKITGKNSSNILKWVFRNLNYLNKELLPTESQKKFIHT